MTASSTTRPRPTTRGRRAVPRRVPPRRVLAEGHLLPAVVVAAVAAVLLATLLPRGPVTRGEALLVVPAALLVGAAAGALARRRVAVLVVPATFAVVLELAQAGLAGPTVDRPRLMLLGVLAWLAVRLVLGLLLLLPLAVGAGWGAQLARGSGFGHVGRAGLVVGSLVILGLLGLVAVPARTAPILGPDGAPLPGSIAELATIDVNGRPQTLLIRGDDVTNPVLLHLAGGPGGTDIGAMRLDEGLEAHFVVVTWDMRGTGMSYRAIDPVTDLTLEGAVADTLAVTDHLRERFGQDRVVLTGQSYGTIPAVLAAARHPERYRAVVATGQMVDVVETDRIMYEDVLAEARRRGDLAAVDQLTRIGPPPYDRWEDALALNTLERGLFTYPEFDGHTEMTATIWGDEHSATDSYAALRGLLDTYALLYPQLWGVDLRELVPALTTPLYVVMGEHESHGRVVPARAWFDQLDADAKEWVELPASGHRASFEQPDRYTELLVRVLAETQGG